MRRRVLGLCTLCAALAALFVTASQTPSRRITAHFATNTLGSAIGSSVVANLGTFKSGRAEVRFKGITLKDMQRLDGSLTQLISQVGARGGCEVISLGRKTHRLSARPCSHR